jgi:hypothetical protein
LQGCFCGYVLRNLKDAPVDAIDNHVASSRFHQIAKASWKAAKAEAYPNDYSGDYADGFEAGFVDFLDANGTGEPPAAPPQHYRHSRYETPAGQRAIEDWFAGFRHGARAAQASGYRAAVVLPLALPPRHVRDPYPLATPSVPDEQSPAEALPSPRVLPQQPKSNVNAAPSADAPR